MDFNTKSVSKITGVSKRRIDYWDRTNLMKPSVREATGYGSIRLYSFKDLVQIRVVKALLDKGVSLHKIRKSIWYLKKNMPDAEKPLSDLTFLTDGETIFVITRDEKKVIDVLRNGQLVFAVALGKMIEELRGEIKDLQTERMYQVKVAGRKYDVKLHPDSEDGGYWVECPEIPGCSSQGDTVEEVLEMIKDAIRGCLDVLAKRGKAARTS